MVFDTRNTIFLRIVLIKLFFFCFTLFLLFHFKDASTRSIILFYYLPYSQSLVARQFSITANCTTILPLLTFSYLLLFDYSCSIRKCFYLYLSRTNLKLNSISVSQTAFWSTSLFSHSLFFLY